MSIKMLALIQGFDVASSKYRILQYLPYLREHDIDDEIRPLPSSLNEKIQIYSMIKDFDLVFLHRKRFSLPEHMLVRKLARKIIYDFDDAIMYHNSTYSSPYSSTRTRRFVRIIRDADHVIAGNTFLRDQCLQHVDEHKVTVIPSSVDLARYRLKDYSVKKDKVTIGWIGDTGSLHYVEKMAHVFDAIHERYPATELKIICSHFFDCEKMPVLKLPWSSETEVDELRDMDIGIMPLIDDPWSWGKCGLKIVQYQAVGLPVVCMPVGVNRDIVSDGVNGLWASNDKQWLERLSILVERPDKRKEMGLKGRRVIEMEYSLETNAGRMLSVIEAVVGAG